MRRRDRRIARAGIVKAGALYAVSSNAAWRPAHVRGYSLRVQCQHWNPRDDVDNSTNELAPIPSHSASCSFFSFVKVNVSITSQPHALTRPVLIALLNGYFVHIVGHHNAQTKIDRRLAYGMVPSLVLSLLALWTLLPFTRSGLVSPQSHA